MISMFDHVCTAKLILISLVLAVTIDISILYFPCTRAAQVFFFFSFLLNINITYQKSCDYRYFQGVEDKYVTPNTME